MVEGIMIPDFNNEIVWHWHKNGCADQWTGIADAGLNPHCCSHLIFDKESKNIHWKSVAFPTNYDGEKLDILM